MSLCLWLPFNENFQNQGVANLTSITNKYESYNASGKIGSCALSEGNNLFTGTMDELTGVTNFSIALWYKSINSSSGELDLTTSSGDTITTNSNTNVTVKPAAGSAAGDGIFSIGVKKSNSAERVKLEALSATSVKVYCGSVSSSAITISASAWNHFAFAIDGANLLIYLNGVLNQKISCPGYSLTEAISIGAKDLYGGYNDFRVYNHALSAREVAELSQGLILHYPMMMPDGIIGGENLIKDIISKPTVDKLTKYSAQTKGLAQDTYFQVTFTEQLQLNTNYTVSYDIEKISGTYDNNKWNFGIGSQNNATKVSFLPGHYEYTFQLTKSSEQNNFLFDDADRPTTPPIIKIKNLKIERGSVATPFTPAPSEVPLWNNHIVYDASGYRHNATYTDTSKPSWDSDSPVGLGSYVFDGSKTYLAAGRGAMVTDAITVSAWIYCSNWANYKTAISCTEGGGWNFEPYNGKLNFALNRGGSYSGGAIGPTLSSISSGWHLITGTYDGYQTKCYLDGKLAEQETASTIKKAITYNSGNGVFIGGKAAGNQTAPASYCAANTKICDVRVYATALSAEDIERLYKVRYAVANNGSVFSYSYIENDSGNVTYGKNGVMMAQDFGAGMGRENLASGTASITATSGTSTQAYSIDIDFWNAHQGETITLSFDYDATNWVGSRFGFEPAPYGTSHHYLGCWVKNSANGKGRFSVTTTIPKGDTFTSSAQNKMYVQGTTSGSVKISRPKIELGAGPTPWCPSYRDTVGGDLEDIDTAQIYENAVIARELYEWI